MALNIHDYIKIDNAFYFLLTVTVVPSYMVQSVSFKPINCLKDTLCNLYDLQIQSI